MSRSVLSWLLKEKKHSQITWVNRNIEKLKEHPESQQVNLVTLEEFCEAPISFSHLFTATASEDPVFDAPFLGKLNQEQKVIFDFAEPPDVDSEACSGLPSIRLVRMSDLKEAAKENKDFRREEAARAEKIIEESMQEYFLEQKEAPVLREFIGVEGQFRSEMKEWLSDWQNQFPAEWHSSLNKLAEHLLKKNLHLSREQLKSALRKVAGEGTEQMTHA
jgi:glutamyl-tRNA reductase